MVQCSLSRPNANTSCQIKFLENIGEGLLLAWIYFYNKVYINDACDLTLSVYPHLASLKNMLVHGGNRTYDLRNTSPMLCQLSYAVRSVRVCDISELSLVPSISM